MSDFNLFAFVENISKELLVLSSRIEGQLFEQPHATLMQTRLFSEQLVKLVSEEEEIEKIYPLKHSERIHKLYRNNAIEEDIYMKLEWLRKKGNRAAHDVKEVEIEDVLKAHKFLFDISVWYMQVYVSYDFEAPIYKLPIKSKQDSLEVEGKLHGLIKPYLDQTFKKIDDMWGEINQELKAIKKEKEQLPYFIPAVEPEKEGELPKNHHFSLLEYLEENELEYVDKRDKKGALWIIGDWSLNEKLIPLKSHKIYFRYSKKGGRTTAYRPAWYMLTKTVTESEITVGKNTIVSEIEKVSSIQATTSEEMQVEQATPSASIINIVPASSDYWQVKGQILTPTHLLEVKLEEYPLEGIKILIDQLEIVKFSELTEDSLRTIYQKSQTCFYKVIMDLYWLGFRFTGNLEKFQPVSSGIPEHQIIVSQESNITIDSILPRHLSTRLVGKLVKTVQDLNAILLNSLEFIFKDDAKYVLKLIQDRANLQGQKTISLEDEFDKVDTLPQQAKELNDKETSQAQITYKGQTLIVTGIQAKIPLTELGIEGCSNLLNRIKKIGVYSLDDIDGPMDDIHLKLPSVGPGTIEKFWNQLKLLTKEVDLNLAVDAQDKENAVTLNGKVVEFCEETKDAELQPRDFPGLENIVRTIIDNGIYTFGQLPNNFLEIGKIKGIGKRKVEGIFHRLPIILGIIRDKKEVDQLPDEERLLFELSAYNDWFEQISSSEEEAKKERIQPRYLRFVNNRYHASLNSKHLTLEALGEQEGVTRERIRQIIAAGDDRVCQQCAVIIQLLTKQLKAQGEITLDNFFLGSDESRYLLWSALERINIYSTKIMNTPVLTLKDTHSLNEYIVGIQREVENIFAIHVVTRQDITTYSRDRSLEDKVAESIIYKTASERINWLTEDQGVIRNLKKIDVAEMVMLQFPNGVEVYKGEDVLIEKANDVMPGGFEGERSFYAIVTRENIDDRFVLWGRGIYIHTRFITDDEKWILSIQEQVEKWLEKEDFIHVLKLYTKIEIEAKSRNVPNEYALYSLLRRYSKPTLSYPRFPTIMPAGVDSQTNNEWVIQYIVEKERPVSTQELIDVFVDMRGWKKFTLEFTLANSIDIIRYEHASYTLLSNYNHIKQENLSLITSLINQQLGEKMLILIHNIFEENEPILKSIGIETKYVLYGVLRGLGCVNAKFKRFPYIVSNDYNFDSFSGRRLIEEYIRDENRIVAREEVNQWVEDLFGQNDQILDLALVHSKDLLYYSKGRYGEYIHRDTINMHDEIEQAVHEIMLARYEEMVERKNRKYVLLEELYNLDNLPKLSTSVPWSAALLGDILKKSDRWVLIGSYDEILLPVGTTITDDIAFIDYILMHHFGGAVKLSKLGAYLSKIRFSSQGNLLTDVNEAIVNGTAQYSVMGDELIHFKLNGGNEDD